MKPLLFLLSLAVSIPVTAQNADAIYQRACGSKDALFNVQEVKGRPPSAPEPGKARVYFIQDQIGYGYTARVGLDGAWAGAFKKSSSISLSVAPGEHHACVSWQDMKSRRPHFVHFNAEAGKAYYYLVRCFGASGNIPTMAFRVADRDDALYLIASDPKSVATPKP
jgi:hypothetical protein